MPVNQFPTLALKSGMSRPSPVLMGATAVAGVPDQGQIYFKKAGFREFVAEYPEDMVVDATLTAFRGQGDLRLSPDGWLRSALGGNIRSD